MMLAQPRITKRRLLPGHVFRINCWDDDGRCFVKLFRDTWRKLPLSVRCTVLQFWRENANEGGPLIELSNLWVPHDSYGQVRNAGMVLKFRQEAFSCFPPQAARWVIAHELAHVYQKACGLSPGGKDEETNEHHADNLAKEWGFDHVCMMIIDSKKRNRKLSTLDACREIQRSGIFDE
jgi:hypothetical protein